MPRDWAKTLTFIPTPIINGSLSEMDRYPKREQR